jgi:PAT family beta-lactamase induction signal transducer AmpG
MIDYLRLIFSNKRMLIMALFGLSSGLPIALTGGTLQAWLTDSGLDIKTIGMLTLVGQPYFYKFLWAPVMDRFAPNIIKGKRRSWILVTQLGVIFSIILMAGMNPTLEPMWLALTAILVAFVSASQDIVIDAYKAEILTPEERSPGSAIFVASYRIAMVISGAGALILADHLGWTFTYWAMACLMGIGIIATLMAEEPQSTQVATRRSLRDAIVLPLRDFMQRDKALWLLLLVVLYKLADAFAAQLMTAFFIGGADVAGLGFTKTEVGLIYKMWGIVATIAGASVAGILMLRMHLFTSLLVFGFFQAVSNLMFVWLAIVGKDYSLLVATVFIENFCSGLGTTAFMTLLIGLCNPSYAIAQYALFTAFAAIGVRFLGPLAGWLVAQVGWIEFFLWSFAAAIPSLILMIYLRKTLAQYDNLKEKRSSL